MATISRSTSGASFICCLLLLPYHRRRREGTLQCPSDGFANVGRIVLTSLDESPQELQRFDLLSDRSRKLLCVDGVLAHPEPEHLELPQLDVVRKHHHV